MLFLTDVIDNKTAPALLDKISNLKPGQKETLVLDTPGGLSDYTYLLCREIKQHQESLDLLACGEVSSHGLTIFFTFPLRKRFAFPDVNFYFKNICLELPYGGYGLKALKTHVKEIETAQNTQDLKMKSLLKLADYAIYKNLCDENESLNVDEMIFNKFLLKKNVRS